MFADNKYTKWYFNIINNAQISNRLSNSYRRYHKININEYYESHHIIPRSLAGTNDRDNLVLLTPKEHFICHLLLTRMVTNKKHKQKMYFALWNMSNNTGRITSGRHKLSARSYKIVRQKYYQYCAGNNRNLPQEWKDKQRARRISYLVPAKKGVDNHMFEGFYITPWGKFSSALEASRECPYGLTIERVRKACRIQNESGTFKRHSPINIPKEWVGKKYSEVGFSFEKIKNNPNKEAYTKAISKRVHWKHRKQGGDV